jgi:hypothetical protein
LGSVEERKVEKSELKVFQDRNLDAHPAPRSPTRPRAAFAQAAQAQLKLGSGVAHLLLTLLPEPWRSKGSVFNQGAENEARESEDGTTATFTSRACHGLLIESPVLHVHLLDIACLCVAGLAKIPHK